MMKTGVKRLYNGDFNAMIQEWQADGSVIITLEKDGEEKKYKFKVKDLYGENEEVSDHQVISTRLPQWVLDRMKEAQGHGKPD